MSKHKRFNGFDPAQYEEEAKQQWGNSPAWAESQKRTQQYSEADWNEVWAEAELIGTSIADRMDRDPADPEVQEWIQKWHQHINDRFYTCTADVFLGLADMYVYDERFAAYWDKLRPGMAQFMNTAMYVYCLSLLREI